MWLTGVVLLAGTASVAVGPSAVTTRLLTTQARPALTADQFAERWPAPPDPVEHPRRREKLRRLVQFTPAADPDKPRFWFLLAKVETERWHFQQTQARLLRSELAEAPPSAGPARAREVERLANGAVRSWEDALAGYSAAAAYQNFEQRDAALYWLVRLSLAAAAETPPR